MIQRAEIVPLLKATWTEFQQDEAEQLGAALAYYATFSIFPLLILLLAALGATVGSQATVRQGMLDAVSSNFSPSLAQTLSTVLDTVAKQAGTATVIGVITLLLGASGVFQQLDRSFNKIWNTPKPEQPAGWWAMIVSVVRERLVSFLMVMAVGFLLVLSMVLSGVSNALVGLLSNVPVVGGVVGFLVSLVLSVLLSSLIFGLIYRYLPDVKLTWRDVLPGALVTGVLWEVAKRLLALYIEHSAFSSAYGAIGTVLVLMVWVYLSSQILFLGAELTQVYSQTKRKQPVAMPKVARASR